MGGEKLSEVKFAYTNQQGKQTISTIKVQQGMNLVFDGETKVEQGSYRIGDDGAIYNAKGEKIDVIQTTKEQMAALQGMSMAYGENGSNAKAGRFILTDADINNSGTENEMYNSSLHVNMRENALGGNKKTNQYESRTKARSGVYETTLRGEGSSSKVSVSSDRTLAQAEKERKEDWERKNPIKHKANEFLGNTIKIKWRPFGP